MQVRRRLSALVSLCAPLFLASSLANPAHAQVTGVPVPELARFDTLMLSYMRSAGLNDGVLGVMKDGVIVYQRGFGTWENTPMRTASVEKPITAAAIRALGIGLDRKVFNLNGNGGLLPYIPWPSLGDERLEDVTIRHLIAHTGGWDRDVFGDPMFMSVQIANEMGLTAPANRVLTLQWMLGQELQNDPGSTYAYSNFGYMCLGMIVELLSGMNHADYIKSAVLTQWDWIPWTELYAASTLQGTQHFREPTYYGGTGCTNVYNVGGPSVPCAYGAFPVENFVGHGHLVSSAAPLLEFADRFIVWGQNSGAPWTSTSSASHTGGMSGTSTILSQRSDDIHVVVLFNGSDPSSGSHAANAANLIYNEIDNTTITWPTESVDGFWINFGSGSSGIGSYDNSFTSVTEALSWTADGTKLRFRPGSSGSWSGTITQRVLMDAPFGSAVIGD